MSTLAFAADVHLGNHKRFAGVTEAGINERCSVVLSTLRRAVGECTKRQVERFFILGDLFDRSDPSPQLLAATQEVLNVEPPDPEVNDFTVVVCGNHELVSTQEGDDALGPLRPVSMLVRKPIWIPVDGGSVLAVPFCPGRALDWFPPILEVMDAKVAGTKILAFHLGVADERTPEWLRGAHDSIPIEVLNELMVQYGFQYAFAGNWHNHRVWDFPANNMTGNAHKSSRTIVQVGTLCPTGFSDTGLADVGKVAFLEI